MNKLFRFVVFGLAIATLQGCGGYATSYSKEWEKGGYKYAVVDDNPTLCSDLEKRWGKSSWKVAVDGNNTTLIHEDGFVWAGLTIFVVIPIPLVIPVGHEYEEFVCKDNKLIQAHGKIQKHYAAYCGILSERSDQDIGCKIER